VREHNEAVNRLDFWPSREAITASYDEGEVIEVPAGAEGSIIRLRKLDAGYDPTDKVGAMTAIARAAQKGEVLTGLLYVSPDAEDLHAHLNTYETAFNTLGEKDLCPGSAMLDKINAGLR
jgi:2-oxoglutarate ferredoxin oxidoreductase subunit beta